MSRLHLTRPTCLSIALAVQGARRGHRGVFATAHRWVQPHTWGNKNEILMRTVLNVRLGRDDLDLLHDVAGGSEGGEGQGQALRGAEML